MNRYKFKKEILSQAPPLIINLKKLQITYKTILYIKFIKFNRFAR